MTPFPKPQHRAPQRGLALLTMLLVTALVALLATTLLVQQDRLLTQAGQVDRYYLRKARALGEEARFMAELRADLASGDPVDGMDAPWLQPRREEGAGIRIERRSRALDALLNVNNLATAAALGRFQRLLKQLELDPNLAFQLADWIDADEEARPGGAEDGFYGDEDPPRRAGNTPFPTESVIPEGATLSQEAWLRLRPLVAALPPTFEQVNVNLAPPEVLATLAPGLEPSQVWPLAQPPLPWTSVGALIGSQAAFAPEEGVLATVSQFFEALILVEAQGGAFTLRSTLYRDPGSGTVRIMSRELGQRFDRWPAPTSEREKDAYGP